MYLPSVGFFFLAGVFLMEALRLGDFRINIALAACLVFFYCGLTVARNLDWKDEITFYKRSLGSCRSPAQAARMHYNLGTALGQKGVYDKALSHLKEAVGIKPDYAEVYANMGLIYFLQSKTDEAITYYKQANSLNANLTENHVNLGIAYGAKGMFKEAREELEKALKANPNHAVAHYNLGMAYFRQGEYALAGQHAEKSAALGYKDAQFLLEQLKPYRK
jgi:tetratricopeptide (TPR) repeat protein